MPSRGNKSRKGSSRWGEKRAGLEPTENDTGSESSDSDDANNSKSNRHRTAAANPNSTYLLGFSLTDVVASLHQVKEEAQSVMRRPTARIGRPVYHAVQNILHGSNHRAVNVHHQYRFWTSRTAHIIYTDAALACVFRRAWILYGALVALLLQVLWVMIKWIVYTIDDPALWKSINFVSYWANLVIKEGEAIFSGDAATSKLLMAGAVPFTAPTGMGYARAILRYKLSVINNMQLAELNAKQSLYRNVNFGTNIRAEVKDLLQNSAHRTKKQLQQVLQTVK